MYYYRLRLPNHAAAAQLAVGFGIDWDGEKTHLTIQNELGRMDVVVLGDLPQQNSDGTIVTTTTVVDEETVETPVMTGKYHIDILSTYRVEHPLADNYLIDPAHPLHGFLGVTQYNKAPRFV